MQVSQPVALAHLDGDWYESIMTCLQRIEPHLVPRGVLVIDDYDTWSGCRKAIDEYFLDKKHQYDFVRRSRLHIIKK
jgi:asparagine synthase (glutamine-hydrolysing)